MDKAREVRRPASRFSPAKRQAKQSGRKLASILNGDGNMDSLERSKKVKVRDSSHVGRGSSSNEGSEMGGGGSEGEEELCPLPPLPVPSTGSFKRFKLSRKLLDNCNFVDPAAVPRKLRSAMNKRTHSPPLPDATSNGIETPQINDSKKSKQGMKQVGRSDQSPRQIVSGQITKDEEEVVETLYALAKMFPNPVKGTVEEKTPEAKSSPLLKTRESSVSTSEASKEESPKSLLTSNTAEDNNFSSNLEGTPGENVAVNILSECTILEQRPSIHERQKLDLGSSSSVAQADLLKVALLSKCEHTDERVSCNAARLSGSFELCPRNGLVQPKQHEAQLPDRKQENMLGQAVAFAMKQGQQHLIKGKKGSGTKHTEGGPVLWPGLYTAGSCDGRVNGPSARSTSTKAPAWLDTAACSGRTRSAGNGVSTEKVSPAVVDGRQSLKRCVAHVYISHLIQAHQTAEKRSRWSIPSDQLQANEGTKSGIVAGSGPTGMRNGLNGVISAGSISRSTEKNPNEARLGIPLDTRVQQDQKQAATTSGIYISKNQSCNFLSLSSGGGGLEASNNNNSSNTNNNHNRSNSAGNGLDPSMQLHAPYLHSLIQHHPLMPFSIPHTHYSSSPCADQFTAAAQVQMQLPRYIGSPFYGPPHLTHADPAKQHHHHQPQIWAGQLAVQYRSGRIPVSHFPKWQSERQEPTSLVPGTQAILPASPHPLEVLGAKFSPSPQQQQQLFAVSSSSSHKGKKQQQQHHHHLPSSYDQGGAGFHSEGSSHLQLICNADLL